MEWTLARCTLRPWRRGDEASLVRHANNRKIWLNLRHRFPHPYTPADAGKWVRTASVGVSGRLRRHVTKDGRTGDELVYAVGRP